MAKPKLNKEEFKFIKDSKEIKNSVKEYIKCYYGERCKYKAPGCCLCQVWAIYDLLDVTISI